MKRFRASAGMVLGFACGTFASAGLADSIMVTKAVTKALPAPVACAGVVDFFTTSCPLSWYGISVYGTVDAGVSWQSHGTPFSPSYGPGTEPLI
jgi:hypothetical protein